jgi:predicted flap endonuclease-1-like 5' DNA nuclease
MAFFTTLVVGIATGTAVKWGYDRYKLRQAEKQVEELLARQVAAASIREPSARSVAHAAVPLVKPPQTEDDLKRINGIGPVFAERLHAGGIYSFAQLATLSPERIHALIAVDGAADQMFIPEAWIAQAQLFAAEQAG